MNPDPPASDSFLRIDAAAAADGNGLVFAPASVLLRAPSDPKSGVPVSGWIALEAIGSPGEVDSHPMAERALRESRPDCVLVPGLVNAHVHMDLSHIGPRPFDRPRGFRGFVDLVRCERVTDDRGLLSVVMRTGIAMCMGGGCVAVGDIGGAPGGVITLTPLQQVLSSKLGGVSFVEFFSIGKGESRGRERIAEVLSPRCDPVIDTHDVLPVSIGLQPHAPTTVSLGTFKWLLEQPRAREHRFSTHLAETPDEHEFIAHARGPHRAFLESLGLWEDRMLEEIGHGRTPVEHMATVLAEAPFLCAHVNDCSDGDLAILERTPTSVAYCPRASDYFGAHEHFGPHRYRDMLAAGINVCLGTDSIINLPPGTDRLSPLDEARFLYQRDRTDPVTLLRMATISGAKALGLNERHFAFNIGSKLAGVLAVPFTPTPGLTPLAAALSCDSLPEHVLFGK